MVLTVQSVLVNRSVPFFARKWFHIRYLGISQTSCQILWYLWFYYLLKCSSPLNKIFEIRKKICCIIFRICGDITEGNSIIITHLTMQLTFLPFFQLKMSLFLWLWYLLILFMWQKGIFKFYPSWLTKAKPQEMLACARGDLLFYIRKKLQLWFSKGGLPSGSRADSIQLCLRSDLSVVMIQKCRGKEASDSEKEMDWSLFFSWNTVRFGSALYLHNRTFIILSGMVVLLWTSQTVFQQHLWLVFLFLLIFNDSLKEDY